MVIEGIYRMVLGNCKRYVFLTVKSVNFLKSMIKSSAISGELLSKLGFDWLFGPILASLYLPSIQRRMTLRDVS